MLSCKEITNKASDYIDNDMSMIARAQLKIHLFMCVNCRNYVNQLKTTIGAIRGLSDTAEVSDKEVEKILIEINNNLVENHNHDNKK